MSDRPLLLNKPLGLTPLQAIRRFKDQYPSLAEARIGAAGRLDPMAEGLLLLMVGEDNKRQAGYLKLDKTYRASLAFGLETDTYDLLGLPKLGKAPTIDQTRLEGILTSLTGQISQSYPPYSAVRVQGKPLYWWSRQGLLDTINIPKPYREIYLLQKGESNTLSKENMLSYIETIVPLVSGDFRQQPIIKAWGEILGPTAPPYFPALELAIKCSSGTYVRSIIHHLGQQFGCGAVTLSIQRTAIGPYVLADAYQITVENK